MTDRRGLFVTFEGVEGGGKSTQMRRLIDKLRSMGHNVVETVEPGGTRIGRQIRRILLEADHRELSPANELLLFFASRAQAVDEIIRPAMSAGRIVISDRFTDSTMAYQGWARGLGEDVVFTLDSVACRGLKPDLTLCLDLDVEQGLRRARSRNAEGQATETRLDDEKVEFHRKVREAYHRIAEREPERVKLVDASQTPDQVAEQIWALVKPLLP